jgi:hypothetical protein
MPYGDDITEGIPYVLSNPAGSTNYSATGEAYDVAIGGLPFFLLNSDDAPYRRVTAQYRKQQIDQSREPGEQTLTGWWLRSQSSFHYGQGIKFFEPIQDESLRFQYTESKGINVWTKGQATLLNSVASQHTVTGGIQTNGRPWQYARSIQWDKDSNTYNGILLSDEYDVDKIFPAITVSITNKELTSNVATLTTSAAHGLSTGMQITISDVDATFDGEHRITSVPTTTTFTFAKVASDVPSAAVSPAGRTGYIRYNTLETKIFKLMQARVDTTNGGILIQSIDSVDNFYTIGNFSQQSAVPEININYPQTAQEYLGFQFTLSRSTTDATKGPLFTGYQLKSLPAVPRQRLIQYPLSCFDHESDSLGVETGYEGSAFARMAQLEAIENAGDSIQIQDFRTGESYIGLIEEIDFRNNTPSDKRFSGFGGLLLVTIRTI